eukprot:gene7908-8762_t
MCGICVFIFSTDAACKNQDILLTEDELATCELLTNRGPDVSGNFNLSLASETPNGDDNDQRQEERKNKTIMLRFHGQVLHLRGCRPKQQPVVDSFGNVLIWNGEIFGGNFQLSETQNDTQHLMDKLSNISSSCTDNHSDFEAKITRVFQDIHGPWAFIYWQNKLKELWFGRDFFGRRSLLWHFPNSSSDQFVLSSVAVRCSKKFWQEVPAACLYRVSLPDISKFYNDHMDERKLHEHIHAIPLSLPKCDFTTSHDVLEIIYSNDAENIANDLLIDNLSVEDQDKQPCCKSSAMDSLDQDSLSLSECRSTVTPSFATSNSADSGCNTTCYFCGGCENIKDLSSLFEEYQQSDNTQQCKPEKIGCDNIMPNNRTDQRIRCKCLHHMILPQLKTNPPDSNQVLNELLLDFYAKNFMIILKEATRRRVYNLPRDGDKVQINAKPGNLDLMNCESNTLKAPKVGILFSGGIDCMTLAAMADRVLPVDEPIDLLNVAFVQQPRPSAHAKRQKNVHSDHGKHELRDPYNVPDRITGRSGVKELNPRRIWNFIEVNITLDEVKQARQQRVQHLLNPLETVLDDSIGCAIWFAAKGKGIQYQLKDDELVKCSHDYCSPVKVLLTGMGADEQLGGYARHRSKFEKFGWFGLESEIKMETERISSRNLGRDDRCISDHGREARFPFLDENVVAFLQNVPVWIKCDPRLERGHGEKRLLRRMATRLGLTGSVSLPKRAIQFGSRIAKLENTKEKGSDSCNRLDFSTKLNDT